jgi:FlaA1/EpsC-like NDP-sugar epimerase
MSITLKNQKGVKMLKKKEKVFIFGAGATGKFILPNVKEAYTVIGFLDNNSGNLGGGGGARVCVRNFFPRSFEKGCF